LPLSLPLPLPWSVPEGAAGGQQWAASSHPSLRSLCMQWFSTGACSKGERCHLVHGELCQVRGAGGCTAPNPLLAEALVMSGYVKLYLVLRAMEGCRAHW
jgi:hypothetical protein